MNFNKCDVYTDDALTGGNLMLIKLLQVTTQIFKFSAKKMVECDTIIYRAIESRNMLAAGATLITPVVFPIREAM